MLLKSNNRINPTKSPAVEEIGVLLELTNPRSRLSRAWSRRLLFGCLGELLWYLKGSDQLDVIQYYLSRYQEFTEPDGTIFGAYGPRLFNMRGDGIDQFHNVIKRLQNNSDTRRAVIQLFDAADILEHHEDVPCTCTFQFLLRDKQLHMVTFMRSNDAYMGLPHDVFAFTMIQEIVARSLGVQLGVYKHMVGSLHLYDHDRKAATQYCSEGFQPTTSMPEMPYGDPSTAIKQLIAIEETIRLSKDTAPTDFGMDPYWEDICRLLLFWAAFKRDDATAMKAISKRMSSDIFDPYLEKKTTAQRVEISVS